MGISIGWRCDSCGAGVEHYCGVGLDNYTGPGIAGMIERGDFGPAMKALFAAGIPEGWLVARKNAFYKCPDCGDVITGDSLFIDDCSGGCIRYFSDPGVCPSCSRDLLCWDEKEPMTQNELWAIYERREGSVCPNCGSANVEAVIGL